MVGDGFPGRLLEVMSQSSVVQAIWPLSVETRSFSENQMGQEPIRERKRGEERGREWRREEGRRRRGIREGEEEERRGGEEKRVKKRRGRGGEIPTSRNILLEVMKSLRGGGGGCGGGAQDIGKSCLPVSCLLKGRCRGRWRCSRRKGDTTVPVEFSHIFLILQAIVDSEKTT